MNYNPLFTLTNEQYEEYEKYWNVWQGFRKDNFKECGEMFDDSPWMDKFYDLDEIEDDYEYECLRDEISQGFFDEYFPFARQQLFDKIYNNYEQYIKRIEVLYEYVGILNMRNTGAVREIVDYDYKLVYDPLDRYHRVYIHKNESLYWQVKNLSNSVHLLEKIQDAKWICKTYEDIFGKYNEIPNFHDVTTQIVKEYNGHVFIDKIYHRVWSDEIKNLIQIKLENCIFEDDHLKELT